MSIPQHNKGNIQQTYSQHYGNNGDKLKAFPLKSAMRQRCLLSLLLFITVLNLLSAVRRRERFKDLKEEEVRLFPFTDNVILRL